MLCAPDGTDIFLPLKLEFPSLINEAEDETLVIGFLSNKWEFEAYLSKEIPHHY